MYTETGPIRSLPWYCNNLDCNSCISITTTDNAFAYEKNQATSQTGACGNGLLSVNIGCQNTDSQIQGDENVVALTAQQRFPA
jgi:hypothetical protein